MLNAKCPVDVVVVRGRVEYAPSNARVRVQLTYHHRRAGESRETKLEGSEFTVPVNFLTQSRGGILLGEWLESCNRRPEAVVVSLTGSNPPQEVDRLTLNLLSDFNEAGPGSYTVKSEIVLRDRTKK